MLITSAFLLYLFPGFWMLFRKRWPIRAGLAMLCACILPFGPLFWSDEPIAPGTGMLILAVLPFVALALLIILAGGVRVIVRQARLGRPV